MLSTGEMIDRLKEGQVAEGYSPKWRVKRIDGGLAFVDESEEIKREFGDNGFVSLVNSILVSNKWRILPQYVSFEEAMKALKEGKTVTWYRYNDELISYTFDRGHFFERFVEWDLMFDDLCEGKWTIEGDNA